MEFVFNLWDVIDKILGAILLVGGVLGFVFRTWIKAWIENKFSSAAAAALETRRHELNQQLEAYKGAVMRDLEQYRANIDIKRSVALKMAEEKLDALRTLATTLDKYINEAITQPRFTIAQRVANGAEVIAATDAARSAVRQADIVVPLEFAVEISRLMAEAQALIVAFGAANPELAPAGHAETQAVMENYARASNSLRAEIFRAPPDLN